MDENQKEAKKKIIDYDVKGLREGVKKCYKNIKIFEDAIKKEEKTIKWYQQMISTLEKDKKS